MSTVRRWTFCKVLAVILCVLIAAEAQYAFSPQDSPPDRYAGAKQDYINGNYKAAKASCEAVIKAVDEKKSENRSFLGHSYLLLGASCEMLAENELAKTYYKKASELLAGEEATIEGVSFAGLILFGAIFSAGQAGPAGQTGVQIDALTAQFLKARDLYFAEDYDGAKAILEKLISDLGGIEGRDTLKGQTYLLAGASYEKLKFKELAIKYYCRAKAILGEGKTTPGLELKKLKYYTEDCAGVGAMAGAAAAPAKKSGFGKILGTLVFLAIIGGAVWYLFFSKNAPLRKKGNYTKVNARFDVTFRGFNSTGRRNLYVDGTKKLDEDFVYSQDCNDTTQCSAAVKSETFSYPIAITGSSFVIKQEYLNWDYYGFVVGTNYKKLCADYTITVDSYEYGDGKDPGSPQIEGLGDLTLDVNQDCQQKSQRIHDCSAQATVTFKVPANASTAKKVFSVSTERKIKLD